MSALIVSRTRHVRDCAACDGSGEIVVNDTNPHGYGPDPQCDEARECADCCGRGEVVEWLDPLLLLAENRRFGRMPFYSRSRQKAMAGYPLAQLRMIEAAIRCDVACREAVSAWREVMA